MRFTSLLLVSSIAAITGCTSTVADTNTSGAQAVVVIEKTTGKLAACDAKLDKECGEDSPVLITAKGVRLVLVARNENVQPMVFALNAEVLRGATVNLTLGKDVGATSAAKEVVDYDIEVRGDYKAVSATEGDLTVSPNHVVHIVLPNDGSKVADGSGLVVGRVALADGEPFIYMRSNSTTVPGPDEFASDSTVAVPTPRPEN